MHRTNQIEEQVIQPFGPTMYFGKLSEETHQKLIEYSEIARQNNVNDCRKALAGNLSEESDLYCFKDDEGFKSVMDELKDHAAATLCGFRSMPTHLRDHLKREVEWETLWVNFMKAWEWNPEHNHSAQMSFVTYLKVPNDMNEEEKHPTQKGNSPTAGSISFLYGENMIYNVSTFNIVPEERDIIMFPAWLRHKVYPFTTDVERWSVAGNFFIDTLTGKKEAIRET